jgi:hypothetical protein
MTTTTDNAPTTQDITAPPDATEVSDWRQHGPDLATRMFTGSARESAGFTVRIGGVQRQNKTCRRWVTVEAESALGTPMEAEAVRQLASALSAAVDEIEVAR